MKIGYDAKRFFLNNTGLGNYSRWLVQAVVTFYPDHQYYLYTPKVRPNKRVDFLRLLPQIKTVLPDLKYLTSLWRTRGIVKTLRREGIEIYHGLSHELPFGIKNCGIKTVLTVHDLIFMRYPQYYGSISRRIYEWKLKYACSVADMIIAISEQTKRDLTEFLNVPAEKITVVYQGCDAAFKQRAGNDAKELVREKYHLPQNYILSVGTVEERKNLLLLIKAVKEAKSDRHVVVIGRQTAYAKQVHQYIARHQLQHRITFLQDVSFEDLPVIYQLADLFVYPSRFEGFGIPILEALNSGVPVIAATGSCLEEAGGPDSFYIDPDDEHQLAAYIDELTSMPELKAKMIQQGLKYARKFDDEKLAEQIMSVYQKVNNHA